MIEPIKKKLLIPGSFHNQRIDSVIAQLLPEYSRSQITQWIKNNLITLNGHSFKPKDKAMAGDALELNVSLTPSEQGIIHYTPEDIPLNIIYEDQEILILNKPEGLVVHPGAGNKEHTLVNALVHHAPQLENLPRAGIIHRLDKDTTGLLIVAKTLTSHTALVREMHDRSIKRQYICLTQGHIISGGTIDTYFGRHPKNRLKMAVLSNGRKAITHYTVKKNYHDFTLLDVELMTGRTHQIRVHMAHIHHPIIGDPLYGIKIRLPSTTPDYLRNKLAQFKRQALHAYLLRFTHPKSQEPMEFSAPLPDDFKELINTLDEYYDCK